MNLLQAKLNDQPQRRQIAALLRRFPCLVGLTTLIAVAVSVGDAVFPVLGHTLHLMIEVIEIPLEHLLEWTLHLSPRQAQGVLAWSALAGVIYLFVRFVQETWREMKVARADIAAALDRFRTTVAPQLLRRPATAVTLTVGLLGAVLFMFT
jgi:hypothetical protein